MFRGFAWNVPEGADILATPGASAPIAMIPRLTSAEQVHIATPTYNEHAAAFDAAGGAVSTSSTSSMIWNATPRFVPSARHV